MEFSSQAICPVEPAESAAAGGFDGNFSEAVESIVIPVAYKTTLSPPAATHPLEVTPPVSTFNINVPFVPMPT
ncbi:MAG TPA: hypothetical protein PK157_22170 [Bryobacteraceae bacterium]|nr:hypothetical protein [Bryobacteraceae bacterium]